VFNYDGLFRTARVGNPHTVQPVSGWPPLNSSVRPLAISGSPHFQMAEAGDNKPDGYWDGRRERRQSRVSRILENFLKGI
jgi:hypothetical protein